MIEAKHHQPQAQAPKKQPPPATMSISARSELLLEVCQNAPVKQLNADMTHANMRTKASEEDLHMAKARVSYLKSSDAETTYCKM